MLSRLTRYGRAAIALEVSLWTAGLVCAFYCLCMYGRAHAFLGVPALATVEASSVVSPPQPGTVIGWLEIPALQLSVPVLEDDQSRSLESGVGHIPNTAMPGGLGSVGLAGHRDTFLRPLSKVAPRMEVRLSGAGGVYRYIVDSTEIVRPEAIHVLDVADRPSLVIVTCYPFHYVGPAPKRFIVHAHLVSLIPESLSQR